MHKHALRYQRLNKDKDELVAQQKAEISSQHCAIMELQASLAGKLEADTKQKKLIASQFSTIAALRREVSDLQTQCQQGTPVIPLTPCKVSHMDFLV